MPQEEEEDHSDQQLDDESTRALNGVGRVSPSRRAEVQEIAERLGYRPDARALSLRSGRTGTIGIVVAPYTAPHEADAFAGLWGSYLHASATFASDHGYGVVVLPAGRFDLQDRNPMDMVIVAGAGADVADARALADRGIPFAAVAGTVPAPALTAAYDMDRAVSDALDALQHSGAVRIGLSCFEPARISEAALRIAFVESDGRNVAGARNCRGRLVWIARRTQRDALARLGRWV